MLGSFGAEFAAEATGEEAEFFFACFAKQSRDGDGAAVLDGNHGDTGSVDVARRVGAEVGGVDVDGDFNGGAADVADVAIEFEKFANFDRGEEVNALKGSGDANAPGELGAYGAGGEVNEGED